MSLNTSLRNWEGASLSPEELITYIGYLQAKKQVKDMLQSKLAKYAYLVSS